MISSFSMFAYESKEEKQSKAYVRKNMDSVYKAVFEIGLYID